jgi:hypothetical protein
MLEISAFTPTPGAAKPGNLYADLQTRTLWLGVDAAVDPAQAVLISDIQALQAEIDGSLAEAKLYTDQQILTRAPTTHTHTSSQITDFSTAVASVVAGIPGFNWVRGMIMQYTGSLADIGVGQLAGWHLCDGTTGTPDLRERFILGAGSRVIGSVNAVTNFNTTAGGGHDHTVNATALTLAQMPSHAHTGNTTDRSAGHQHFVSGVTDAQGNHQHGIGTNNNTNAGASGVRGGNTGPQVVSQNTEVAGAHQHNWSGWTGGENQGHVHGIYAEGSNQGHTHTVVGGGGVHQHNITGAQMRDSLPFYALAFIMKL